MTILVSLTCPTCVTIFEAYPAHIRQGRRYCSRGCALEMQAKERAAALPIQFWLRVDIGGPADCWPWLGRCNPPPANYGRFTIAGRRVLAHRTEYELAKGPLDVGLFACHSCDNPPCCNPAHLFPGTHQDNISDMWSKGRSGVDKRSGVLNGKAKITEAQVSEIRARATSEDQRALAREFGIAQSTLSAIALRKTWKHIP